MSVNVTVARGFSVVLWLVGLLGFVLPDHLALTSGATPYNLFHVAFGVVGFACAFSRSVSAARAFNLGFGVIDLLQALASLLHWWPEAHFRWTPVDDVLHVVVGAALIGVALLADPRTAPAARSNTVQTGVQ